MQGHAELIAMRSKGRRPAAVNLHIAAQWPAKPGAFDMPCHEVFAHPAESPQRADLRFVVGLDVVVTAPEGEGANVLPWCRACVAAGAAQVIGYEETASTLAPPVAERLLFDHRKEPVHG
jgi:hypothetical protein